MQVTKGMDNPILTSNRTLSKDNNLISETYKVIHNMFMKNK